MSATSFTGNDFVSLSSQDSSLRTVVHCMKENGVTKPFQKMGEKLYQLTQTEEFYKNMKRSRVLRWFQAAGIPDHLRENYWRAMNKFSRYDPAGIKFYQLFVFFCVLYAPHEGIWRFIRNFYIFSAFSNLENELELSGYHKLVSYLRLGFQQCNEFVGDETSSITDNNWKLSVKQWMDLELSGLFPNCTNILRIPQPFASDFMLFISLNDSSLVQSTERNQPFLINPIEILAGESGVMNIEGHAFKKVTGNMDGLFIAQTENPVIVLAKRVIKELLLSRPTLPERFEPFTLTTIDELNLIITNCGSLLYNEANIVSIPLPCKVFGDIHGQLNDLLDFFEMYGSPNHYKGDIEMVSYVFNGDFIDRGPHSLEVITLLYCLKCLYPKNIFLIRGNHEDKSLNEHYGFQQECVRRFTHPEAGSAVWKYFNLSFDYLPVGGLIENQILVVHGGIGSHFQSIVDLQNNFKKPFSNPQQNDSLRDILWSDPAERDNAPGGQSQRGHGISTFSSEQVNSFCEKNNISKIIRSHQCVQDGFEFFAEAKVITIFSATNYMGNSGNRGAILFVSRDSQISVKGIGPKENMN